MSSPLELRLLYDISFIEPLSGESLPLLAEVKQP